jgi:adenylyltransferase/sulfurtransferase
VGEAGLGRIRDARVAVVGIGGLGCTSAAQLAGLGVGVLRVVDNDVVDQSNLQRQQLYTDADVGKPKAEVAKQRLAEINPDVSVEALPVALTESSADRIVQGIDVIIDGLDRFAPRYALNRACIRHKAPYVFAGALGSVGNMTTIIPTKTACLDCILGEMEDTQPSCVTVGVYPTLVSIIGNLQVHEALRIILQKPPHLANRLLFFDIEQLGFDVLSVLRNPDCPTCGSASRRRTPPVEPAIVVTDLCTEETFLVHSSSPQPLDIDKVRAHLQNRFPILSKTAMGIQIQWTSDIQVSIVGEGNILIKGAKNREQAEKVYRHVMREIRPALPIS